MNPSNLLQRLDACPPFLCYYGAHMGRPKRPTAHELTEASGLAPRTFMRISQQISWAEVTVTHATAFAKGCGVNPLDPGPLQAFIAQQVRSGELVKAFHQCGGAGERMLAQFNLLASKAVLAREKSPD